MYLYIPFCKQRAAYYFVRCKMTENWGNLETQILPPIAIVSTDNPPIGPLLYINHDYTEYARYQDWKTVYKNRTVLPTEA